MNALALIAVSSMRSSSAEAELVAKTQSLTNTQRRNVAREKSQCSKTQLLNLTFVQLLSRNRQRVNVQLETNESATSTLISHS